jgi:hypothetical protein
MRFEIPFDEAIYREQTDSMFIRAWKKNNRKIKENFITAIILIALGAVILYGDGNIGGVLILMGLFILFYSGRVYLASKDAKKKYAKTIENQIVEYKVNPITVWEFEDGYFRFVNYGGDYKTYWKTFHHLERTGQNLLFGTSSANCYTLSESELSKDTIDSLELFLKEKIKAKD